MRALPLSLRSLLAPVALAAVCHTTPALATDFALGEISAPTAFSLGNDGLLGAFSDVYSFSIAAANAFEFESFVSTGFSRRNAIPDMVAALYSIGGSSESLVANGFAQTVLLPEGFPSREITFAPLALGPGDYRLVFSGEAISFDPEIAFTSSYSGLASFSAVSAIPEPATYWLLSIGTLALLIAARPRKARRPG